MRTKVQLVANFKREKKNHMYMIQTILVILALILSILECDDLNKNDRINLNSGILLFLYGLVFFTSLYYLLNNLILRTNTGQKFLRTYKLCNADGYDISNKLVSAVQAIFCCITGITCCSYSCRHDILHTSHFISEAYAWFGAAYFLYDIWSMYQVHMAILINQQQLHNNIGDNSHNNNNNSNSNHMINSDNNNDNNNYDGLVRFCNYLKTHAVIVGHHLFIGGFGFLVITYLRGGLGDCFFGFVYLMEASTPFVSLRGILSKIGLKSSKLYVYNGIIMLITFFICRVIMFPLVIYLYAYSINLDYISAIRTLPTGCKISILILLLPQIYWFLLMLRGASQVLKSRSSVLNGNTIQTTATKKKTKHH